MLGERISLHDTASCDLSLAGDSKENVRGCGRAECPNRRPRDECSQVGTHGGAVPMYIGTQGAQRIDPSTTKETILMNTYTIRRIPSTPGLGRALTPTALALVGVMGFVTGAHTRKGGA